LTASGPGGQSLATVDTRPFFDRALAYGAREGLLDRERLTQIEADIAKGVVQIANYFGTAHLRPELELALTRMVRLMSLYLEDASEGDLRGAALSLRDKTLLSHSKGGSDLLKALLALPDNSVMPAMAVSAEQQRAWLDDKTHTHPMTLADYRAEREQREGHRDTLAFAHWLGKQLGVAVDEVDNAEALIRSAMLVLFVKKAKLELPTRTGFVKLAEAAKKPRAALDAVRFELFFAAAPDGFPDRARAAMDDFLVEDLPRLRAASADELLDGDHVRPWFVRESLDEAAGEYDKLVAKTWHRVTKGDGDDPQVVSTVLLRVATGLDPKATLLLKDGRELIAAYRERGFDDAVVQSFIDEHVPVALREELTSFWNEELAPEAGDRLADTDPDWPDAHMERSLAYLRATCRASWKARRA